jgi:hypothetical protein
VIILDVSSFCLYDNLTYVLHKQHVCVYVYYSWLIVLVASSVAYILTVNINVVPAVTLWSTGSSIVCSAVRLMIIILAPSALEYFA